MGLVITASSCVRQSGFELHDLRASRVASFTVRSVDVHLAPVDARQQIGHVPRDEIDHLLLQRLGGREARARRAPPARPTRRCARAAPRGCGCRRPHRSRPCAPWRCRWAAGGALAPPGSPAGAARRLRGALPGARRAAAPVRRGPALAADRRPGWRRRGWWRAPWPRRGSRRGCRCRRSPRAHPEGVT